MAKIVAITNLKGGIGKTTTVVNVGAGFALRGARVLLVDVDAQGNLALALGVTPRRTLYEPLIDGARVMDCITSARPRLDLLAADETLLTAQPTIATRPDWSRLLEKTLRPVRNEYDFIFIDCGGSLTVLNVNALVAASDVIVPTTVERLSLKGLDLLFRQLRRIKESTSAVRIIVPTMYDARTRQSHELLAELQNNYGQLVAPPIRVNVKLSESTSAGRTIYEYDPRSRGALDYARLVEHLAQLFGLAVTVANPPATATPAAPVPLEIAPQPAPALVQPQARVPHSNGTEPPHQQPVVTGSGYVLQSECPYCGRPLQRTTVAGYRVAYCDHCQYKHQELASGNRR
jgi:chromosome partitioning protein